MRFYGLLGEKLSHSLSPEIHHFLFQRLNIEASYCLFPVPPDKLGDALAGLRLLGAGGVNVTIPYKRAVIPLLDELSEEAKTLGAVNTIVFSAGRTVGHNTDYAGFGLMLKRAGILANGKTAVVLGTGGAAQTAACWLRASGAAEVRLVSRQDKQNLGEFPVLSYADLDRLPMADILVNATPVGMYPHVEETPVDKKTVSRFGAVVDLIYNPAETCLLRFAREQRHIAVNGLSMLAAQAVAAQELWLGRSLGLEMVNSLCDFVSAIPAWHTKNIVLIGMPGSGKTTLGRCIAQRLGWEFCDTDQFVEQRSGRMISEIFRDEGETAFRRLESAAVAEFSQRRRAVIATGGGVVKDPANMRLLSMTGQIVYIDRPLSDIAAAGPGDRPLLKGDGDKLGALYQERRALYEEYADTHIINNHTLPDAIEQILTAVKGEQP